MTEFCKLPPPDWWKLTLFFFWSGFAVLIYRRDEPIPAKEVGLILAFYGIEKGIAFLAGF